MNGIRLTVSFITLILVTMAFTACNSATPAPTDTSVAVATQAPSPTPAPTPTTQAVFTLTSNAFANGGDIPDQYTYQITGQCEGENISPQLSWVGAPNGTQSFALFMIDPDGGNFVHWIQFNIPGDTTELPEVAGGPDIGVKALNYFRELGYSGPCPPSGTHHYTFTLYALDTLLSLEEGVSRTEVAVALEGHILAETQLVGVRSGE